MAFLCKDAFVRPQIKATATRVQVRAEAPLYTGFKVRFLSSSETFHFLLHAVVLLPSPRNTF